MPDLDSALRRIKNWFVPVEAPRNAQSASDLLRTWVREIDACAREQGGAIAARTRAAGLMPLYQAMNPATRIEALTALAVQLKPDVAAVRDAFAQYTDAGGREGEWQAEVRLRESMQSPRSRVIRLLGSAFGGVRFLVALRAEMLDLGKQQPPQLPWRALEAELEAQLADWFDIGFLELRRINWESPAHLLEKLIAYEAVHEIHSWADMKNRLDGDRRVYAFFHPRLRDEPLVFVEVALTADIAGNVQALLDEAAPVFDTRRARAAMFYSISSTQSGLRGISFGNFLLKRVVEDLKRDFPKLEHFVTLSPIPGFAGWLARQTLPRPLRDALAIDWRSDGNLAGGMRAPLMSLAAHYLRDIKRSERPVDSVARFHLGNGARLERLNWLADVSEKGMNQSHGLMVNYYYDLDDIEKNLEAFDAQGTVAVSGRLARLAEVGRRMLLQSQAAGGKVELAGERR